MSTDVLDELASVLHGQGCGEVCVCADDARALLPTVQRLITDAEKRAAAAHQGIVREATDLCWKATPFAEDATGAITTYLLPAGVVHRLLGALQGAGYPAAFRALGGEL